MPVTVKGSGGGGVTLDAGSAASNTTLTLPNTSGTILQSGTAVTVAQGGTGAATLTANGALIGNGTSAVTAVSPTTTGNVLFTTDGSTWSSTAKIVAGTAVASTSGTSIDFTSIPSWAKRVTVMMNGVSTSGTSAIVIQIGAGSVVTTGYNSATGATTFSGSAGMQSATGYFLISSNISAATFLYGSAVFSLMGSNTWVCLGTAWSRADTALYSSGTLALGGSLDRVRITTAGGTDTFDAGSINIMYE